MKSILVFDKTYIYSFMYLLYIYIFFYSNSQNSLLTALYSSSHNEWQSPPNLTAHNSHEMQQLTKHWMAFIVKQSQEMQHVWLRLVIVLKKSYCVYQNLANAGLW